MPLRSQHIISIILFLFLWVTDDALKAQSPQHGGQANNWSITGGMYNNHEWLNFNGLTANPFQLPNSNHFNASLNHNNSVSDKGGNLMFYVYTSYIYDSTNQIMQNGTLVDTSTSQIIYDSYVLENIIIPKPCSPNSYYLVELLDTGIIHPPYNNSSYHIGLYYTEINMMLNNNKGAVVQGRKRMLIQDSLNSTFTLTATKHANNSDYWLMSAVRDTNIYQAWRVMDTGIVTTPVISSL
ncbi:MAG: hypothetical protein RI557_11110, partial [Salibacter sp.]|nr:hypothetical protein [Salibacter sp.]